MIAVIGGIKIKIEIKMKLPEAPKQDNWAAQLEKELQQEDAFEAMQAQMRAEQQRFWQGDGNNQQTGIMGQVSMTNGDEDEITVTSSGCALNVAKHLAGMGDEVRLITVIGTDPLGLAVREEIRAHGIDTALVRRIDGQTPVHFEVKNFAGEVEFARAGEALHKELSPQQIDAAGETLAKADAILIDGSLPQETMQYITEKYGDKTKIFFDPASRAGGAKVCGEDETGRAILQKLYCVLPGRVEAEKMAHMIILGPDQLQAAANYFAECGVRKSIITIKGGGIYYMDADDEEGKSVRPNRVLRFAETTGAGDVVSATVIHEMLEGADLRGAVEAAMAAAAEFLAELPDERPY
ncbi:MAG: bifunctional hydroxymethylpyrimidine kinase/phosphomethylpyrimidine kinase [Firmicutes bacterium]|nr:bifunctional hydroxymethylpyrimidine kinase/phosphomethylpyrimidine kinase [Bacillota bacterium]